MKLVILSAGRGERLWPLTKNTPKSLLEVAGGVTLLEAQLAHAQACGIEEVVLVVGYKAEQIEAKVRGATIPVRTIYNPFFDISNNLVSAWLARGEMDKELVLLNGDVVFHPKVLAGLLDPALTGDLRMVVDRKDSYDDDDMKVQIDQGRILKVSKKLPPTEGNGESIGMIRFSPRGAGIFRQTLDAMVREPENRNVFYLAAMQRVMDSGVPVNYFECARDDWAEVDFHPDLQLLRTNIDRYSDRIASWTEGGPDRPKR